MDKPFSTVLLYSMAALGIAQGTPALAQSLPPGEEAGPRYTFKLDDTGDRAQLHKQKPKSLKEAMDRLHTTVTRQLSDATKKRLEDIWKAGENTPDDNNKRYTLLNEWMNEQIARGSTDAASALAIEALRAWCGSSNNTTRQLFYDHLRRAFSSPEPVRKTNISCWLYHMGDYTQAPSDNIYPLMDAINGISKEEITSRNFFVFYPYSNWQTQAWRLWTAPEEYAPAVTSSRSTWGINNLGYLLHDFNILLDSNIRSGLNYWHSTYGTGNLPAAVKTTMQALRERHEGKLPQSGTAGQILDQSKELPAELLGFIPRCTLAVLPASSPWKPLDDPDASVFMMPDTSAVHLPQWDNRLLGKASAFKDDLKAVEQIISNARKENALAALMAFAMKESALALPNNYYRSWLGVEGYDTFYSSLEIDCRKDGIDIVVTPEGPKFSANDPQLRRTSRELTIALHKCVLKLALLEQARDNKQLAQECAALATLLNREGLWPLLCCQYEMRGVTPEAYIHLLTRFEGKPEILPAFAHAAGMPVISGLAKTAGGGSRSAATQAALMRDFMVMSGAIPAPNKERRTAAATWVKFAQDMNSPEAAQIICLHGMADILAVWDDIPAAFISGKFSYTGYHLVREALARGDRKRAETIFARMTAQPDGYFHAPTRLALALLNRAKGNHNAAQRNEQDALIVAVIQTQRDSFFGYVQRKAVMEHGLLRETEKLLFLHPGRQNTALLGELAQAYAEARHFESAAFLTEYLIHRQCMKSTPASREDSQRNIVEMRLKADAYRGISLLRQGKKLQGETLLHQALASMPAASPKTERQLGALISTCRDVTDRRAWAAHAPASVGKAPLAAAVNDLYTPVAGAADTYRKPGSAWYDWHILKNGTPDRTERAQIITADYGRMKGKWVRVRNEAGREFKLLLDNLTPDAIDNLLDWKQSNGIRTWEYQGSATPPFDGLLVDKRDSLPLIGSAGKPIACIRKTNGSISTMALDRLTGEARNYVNAWQASATEPVDEKTLHAYPSWRQAVARAECAQIPAVAFVLGKKGGPEEAAFNKKVLSVPGEIARLNRQAAVVICYKDDHGNWDACGREVFTQLHFTMPGMDPDGNMPPENIYSSGLRWVNNGSSHELSPMFKTEQPASPAQNDFRNALKANDRNKVTAMLKQDKSLATAIFPDTRSSALLTAIESSSPEIVSLLIDNGANVKSQTINGMPMLLAACIRERKEIVAMLLKAGADPNVPSKTASGHETYALSFSRGNADIIRMLLAAGARFDKTPSLPLDTLMSARSPELLQLLAQQGITLKNTKSEYGDTPLKRAISGGHVEQVTLFLKQGADPNQADPHGYPPLCQAVQINGKPEILKLLIAHGANVNALCGRAKTSVLDEARKHKRPDKEKILLEHGAKPAAELNTPPN